MVIIKCCLSNFLISLTLSQPETIYIQYTFCPLSASTGAAHCNHGPCPSPFLSPLILIWKHEGDKGGEGHTWDARCCRWALPRCCGPVNESPMKKGCPPDDPNEVFAPPSFTIKETSYLEPLCFISWNGLMNNGNSLIFLVLLLLNSMDQELQDRTYQVYHSR